MLDLSSRAFVSFEETGVLVDMWTSSDGFFGTIVTEEELRAELRLAVLPNRRSEEALEAGPAAFGFRLDLRTKRNKRGHLMSTFHLCWVTSYLVM